MLIPSPAPPTAQATPPHFDAPTTPAEPWRRNAFSQFHGPRGRVAPEGSARRPPRFRMNQARTITKHEADENCGFRCLSAGILSRLVKTSAGARGSTGVWRSTRRTPLAMLWAHPGNDFDAAPAPGGPDRADGQSPRP